MFFAGFSVSLTLTLHQPQERRNAKLMFQCFLIVTQQETSMCFARVAPETPPALNKLSIIIRSLICPLTRSFFYFINITRLSILTSYDYSLREV